MERYLAGMLVILVALTLIMLSAPVLLHYLS